jgi:hypothetical protein
MKIPSTRLKKVQFALDDEDAGQQTNGAGYGCSKCEAMIFSICAAQDVPSANGIWARGDLVILFARLNKCGAPYRPVQPLVSTDGGNTWGATGPRLESSDLEYFLDAGSELFTAGEDIAEGPASSPFLLVYRATDNAWQQSEIYDQASELLGIAREQRPADFWPGCATWN